MAASGGDLADQGDLNSVQQRRLGLAVERVRRRYTTPHIHDPPNDEKAFVEEQKRVVREELSNEEEERMYEDIIYEQKQIKGEFDDLDPTGEAR